MGKKEEEKNNFFFFRLLLPKKFQSLWGGDLECFFRSGEGATFFFIGLSGELDLPDKRPIKILNPQMRVYAAPQARQKNIDILFFSCGGPPQISA